MKNAPTPLVDQWEREYQFERPNGYADAYHAALRLSRTLERRLADYRTALEEIATLDPTMHWTAPGTARAALKATQ